MWDVFRSYITENSKTRVARTNTDIAVLPGGLTSRLQPLDVSLNKPFKENVRDEWNSWMMHGKKSFTKGEGMCAAFLYILCEFVIKSWGNVKTESAVRSFKKCGMQIYGWHGG